VGGPVCVSVSPTTLIAIEQRNCLSRDLRTVATPPAAPQPACKHKKRRLHPVRTYSPKPGEIQRDWYVVDATDVVLGRLAAQIATLLRGKHKPTFAPHVDGGDLRLLSNPDNVARTGAKPEQKNASRHSGYPGGLKASSSAELPEKNPERAVMKEVQGRLPKNRLGRAQLSNQKVYA